MHLTIRIILLLFVFSISAQEKAEPKKSSKKINSENNDGELLKEIEKPSPDKNEKKTTDEKETNVSEKNSSTDVPKQEEKSKEIIIKLPETKVEIFGFIKADYVYSSQAMLSFGRENLTAPNQVKRVVQVDDRDARSLFSMRETSIGFKPKFGENLSSVIQFDLMDINQGNAGPAGRPRIVQAFIEYKFGKKAEIFAGQKWDIFSPLYPDTYNIISGLLGSGNLGWFREQMGAKHFLNSNFNLTYSLGNSNLNTAPSVSNNVELTKTPTAAIQLEWIPNTKWNIYFSGIYSNLKYYEANYNSRYINYGYEGIPVTVGGSGPNKVNIESKGLSFSYQWKPSQNFLLKGEFHFGQNLDNLSLLSVSSVQQTSLTRDLISNTGFDYFGFNAPKFKTIHEQGTWFSFTYKFAEVWELIGLSGITRIKNIKDLNAGYDTSIFNFPRVQNYAVTQPNRSVWGANEIGSVVSNSTIGGSISRIFEGNLKLFLYYQFTETKYFTSEGQKTSSISFLYNSITTGSRSNPNSINPNLFSNAGDTPHAHLIRMGMMMTF